MVFKGNERLKSYKYGEEVRVDDLDPFDRAKLLKMGYASSTFKYALNNPAANRLLKIVPLSEFVKEGKYEGVAVGIRWDENPAKAGEVFFSRRADPAHVRVQPILPFLRSTLWNSGEARAQHAHKRSPCGRPAKGVKRPVVLSPEPQRGVGLIIPTLTEIAFLREAVAGDTSAISATSPSVRPSSTGLLKSFSSNSFFSDDMAG